MLDENKICFITCVTNEKYYKEAILYLHQLVIPNNMTTEYIAIRHASSMAAGYNEAMQKSTAKFKIYLHQDFFLTNKNAVAQILNVFNKEYNIGMIGLAGCIKLPQNMIWWRGDECVGKIYHSYVPEGIHNTIYGEMDREYTFVQAIDGVFIATQYDIRWRDDVVAGWHFYDISQSMEFYRAGYKVAIPNQEFPWGVHVTGKKELDNSYLKMREKFMAEYIQDIL